LILEQGRDPGQTDEKIMLQGETLSSKLDELGISRTQSHRWQEIAGVPDNG